MTNNSPEIYDGDITRNVDWKIKSFESLERFKERFGEVSEKVIREAMLPLITKHEEELDHD